MDGMGNNYLGAEILMDFSKSIENVEKYSQSVEGLNSDLGRLEGRLEALKGFLNSTASTNTTNNLKANIEAQIKRAVMENGVVIESVGDKPFVIKKDVMASINRKIESELNSTLAKQAESIKLKLDPSAKNATTTTVGANHFDDFNNEVANMVKNQMAQFNRELKKMNVSGLSTEDLQGMSLTVGKDTVRSIIASVKREIKPILENPVVDTEGIQLKVTAADTKRITNSITSAISRKLAETGDAGLDIKGASLAGLNSTLAKIVNDQINTLNKNLSKMDLGTLNRPVQDLNDRTRALVADQIGMTREQLDKSNFRMTNAQIDTVHIQESFNKMGTAYNKRVTQMSNEMSKEVIEQIKRVSFDVMPGIQYELNDQLKSINNALMRKLRQQIDQQMKHIQAEIEAAGIGPTDLHRTNALRANFGPRTPGVGGRVSNTTNITNYNYNNGARQSSNVLQNPTPSSSYGDPYARRDAHFASMGFESAITNTLRHIAAGTMVGAPILAVYQAINSFKETQLEYLKIFQNYALKDNFKGPDGKPDYALAQSEVEKLMPDVKRMSNFYAIDYSTMSQVAAVSSRLTNSAEEAKQFMDYASMIYRLDNEGDIVNDIAPGLEAIMGQFGKSVWEMDEVVKAFAYATNVTKATTEELMAGLSRSGSTFNAAGIDVTTATMMMATAVQATGLSGADVGNMFKTLNTRLGMKSTRNKLEDDFGIDVYETDDRGRRVRRDGADILTDIANLVATKPVGIGDDLLDELLMSVAGGHQIGKVRAFIESMNTAGKAVTNPDTGETFSPINVLKMAEEARKQEMEDVLAMVQHSLDNPAISMDRAGVAVNTALTSILEEMAPTIESLADGIVNLSNFVQKNSDTIASLIGVLMNAAVGFAAVQGVKWVGGKTGFKTHQENAGVMDNIFGAPTTFGRGGTESNIRNLTTIMGDELSAITNKTNKSFGLVSAAMATPLLAPIFQELSDMDERRAKQVEEYNDDRRGGARVNSMGDLASLLQESRGYNNGDMGEDETRARGNQAVRAMAERAELRYMFSDSMRDAIQYLDTDLDNGQNKDKVQRTMGTFARMDLGDFDNFARFLEEDGQRNGTRLRNIQDLTDAYGRYSTMQRTVMDLNRQQNPQLEAINNSYAEINRQLNRQSSNRSFNDFLTTSRRNVTALSGSLMSLGKSIGSMGAQMAMFMAIGDVISGNISYGAMTETQRKESNVSMANKHNESFMEYYDTLTNKDSSFTDKLAAFLEPGTVGIYNGIVDMFTKGDAKTDITDFFKSMFQSKEALREMYGTDDLEKIRKETGMTTKQITDSVNKHLGLYDELQEAQEKSFYEEYNQFRNDQELQERRKQEAIDSRNAYTKQLLESGATGYTKGSVMESVEADLKKAKEEGSMEEIKALLNGVKTNSQAYYDILIGNLQKEIDTYDKYLSDIEASIAEREALLADIPKLDEEGNPSKEYKKIKEELEELRGVRDDVAKETEKARQQALLEQKKAKFDRFMSGFNERVSVASFNKYMDEFNRDMTTVSGSREEIERSKAINRNERAEIESRISELQANRGNDVNGVVADQIREWQKKLADNTKEMSQIMLNSLGVYQDKIDRTNAATELKMLQAQVASGITDSNDPALKAVRLGLLSEQQGTVNSQISELQKALADAGNFDPDYRDALEKQLVEYQKQSLQIQLEQLQEMKASRGTFNLPDGVRVMSQLDYVMGQGSHSQYTVQSGDTYVTVVMPNVTGTTSQATLNSIGQNLGQGINQGRTANMRGQISSNPGNYRVLT